MRRSDAVAGGAIAISLAGWFGGIHVDNLHNGLLAVSFAAVGAFLLHRRANDREGQLFVAAGLAQAVLFLGRQVGAAPPSWLGTAAAEWLGWLGVWPLALVMVLVGAAIMRFPDGRLPSPTWQTVQRSMVAAGAVLATTSALWAVDYDRAGVVSAPPFSLPGESGMRRFFDVAQPVVFTAFQLTWLVSVAVRRARASEDERRQLRWLIGSVGVSVLVLLIGLAVDGSPTAGLLTVPLIPVAAGIAIVQASYEQLVREVRDAALRVVEAEDAARQRIERDLHDGAQHQLVVLGMDLGRLVDRAEAHGDAALSDAAKAARDRLLEATAELRELSRGIHPSTLRENGLVVALEAIADSSPIPVRLHVDGVPRCSQHVETTAYYVITEALTNTARHSDATVSDVHLAMRHSWLHIDVGDDGTGGAAMGGGLRGIADRVVSIGGRFLLDSPPGAGTRVRVELPCR